MKLALETTDCVDLRHAHNLPQLRSNHPVLQGPQRRCVIGLPIRLPRIGRSVHGVLEDLAETGCDRSHRRLDAGGQLTFRLLQPLVDEIAGEIDISAVVKHDRDL